MLTYANHQEYIAKIFSPPLLPPLEEKALKLLEFGCGAGALTRQIAHRFPAARILALDINEPLIHIAKRVTPSEMMERIDYKVADVSQNLKVESDFDGVYCRFLLEEFAQPQVVLEAMVNAIKPGGFVSIKERLNRRCQLFPSSQSAMALLDAIPTFYEKTYSASPWVGENLEGLFQRCGLSKIEFLEDSQTLSNRKNPEVLKWYVDSVVNVAGLLRESLLQKSFIDLKTFEQAIRDFQSLTQLPNASVIEVTASAIGYKLAN